MLIDNILYSLNAVVPLILLIALGFVLKHKKILSQEFFNGADKLVFNVALPVFIFNEISNATSPIGEIFDIKLVIFCVGGILVTFLLLMFFVPVFVSDKFSRGAFIQGIYRANFALLGIALAGNLYGTTGSATAALIMPFAIPLFNIMAVIALAIHSPEDNQNSANKINLKKMMLNILTNPLIIAVALGIPFMFFEAKEIIPPMFQKTLMYLGNISTPLALLSLGAGVNLANFRQINQSREIRKRITLSIVASITRVVVLPLIFVVIAVLLGFRDAGLVVVFVLFGTPTAVSSYIMAKNMKGNYELAGEIVVLTTLICPATIFVGSFILRTLGLL